MSSVRFPVLLFALASTMLFPASASAWETIGPVTATYLKSEPGAALIADSYDYSKLPMSEWVMGDPRPSIGEFCFSKAVKVEARIRGKRTISYTGGPDCLNANWGGTKREPIEPCFVGPGQCGTRSVDVPPDPEAVKLYGGTSYGRGAISVRGQAKGYGVEIFACETTEGDYQAGACVGLTAKKKTAAKTVDWRIYYDGRLIGAETVRLWNRYIPARKGKGIYYWQGTDGYWNVCVRQNRDVYSRNGRLYCYVQTRAPRKAKWEPMVKRIAGPNPGRIG